jgi:hypothetical protein
LIKNNYDFKKLPSSLRFIITDYLKPLNPDTPDEALLLAVLVQISKMACYNRVKILDRSMNFFPNIY